MEDDHLSLKPGQPLWSSTFLPFRQVIQPGVFIDSIEGRIWRASQSARWPGTRKVMLEHFLAPPEEFEAMLIETNGDVYIWTTMFVVWLERGSVERLRSAFRTPPAGSLPD